MANRIRAFDWAATPLGPSEAWPPCLRSAVEMALDSTVPVAVHWGEDAIQICNDAFAELLGGDGSDILGRPFASAPARLREALEPYLGRVRRGEHVELDERRYIHGIAAPAAEAWYRAFLLPLRVEDGRIEGTMISVVESIGRAEAEQRRDAAELAQRESEARFRALFDSIDTGFCIIDLLFDADGAAIDYRFIEVNAAFERHTGVQDVVGRTMRELVPEHEQLWFDTYGAIARLGEPQRFEAPARAFDNRWYEVYAFPMRELGPDRVGVLFSDITERKRAEEALREGEARLAAILEHVPAGIGLFDAAGRFLLVNPRLRPLVSDVVPSQDAASRWRSFDHEGRELPPHDYPGARALRGETVPTEVDFVAEIDGQKRWFLVGAAPLMRNDAVGGGIMIAHDITERRRVEEALRESELRQSTLIGGIPQLVWRSRDNGEGTWVSPQWTAFTGQEADAAVGLGWLDVVHPEDRESTLQAWAKADAADRVEVEHRIRAAADGRYVWHSTRSAPLRDAAGRVIEWLGTTTDIQQMKELQSRQDVLMAELEEADRRKNEFLATLAHELRNPLAPLSNAVQLIKLGNNDARLVGEVRPMMERQLHHMVRLVDDLLDVSRISRGTLVLQKSRTTLQAVVQTALEASRPGIDAAGHRLDVDLPAQPLELDADETRLSQVVSNLLNNAARYTPPGGRIRLAARSAGPDMVLTVQDNGIGIAGEMLPKVFELFVQASGGQAASHGGLGIGLTIARRLVEMHDGQIEVASDGLGKGSTFMVRLPMAAARRDTGAGADAQAGARPRRVLVADDNRDAANTLLSVLRMMGHEAQVTYDGAEALAAAAVFRPDIALLDLGMPRMDGLELARRIRAEAWGTDIFLVALTGWGGEADRQRSRDAGFDRHVAKPIDIETLRRILAEGN
jgi:PAS domain S-box-containing protein